MNDIYLRHYNRITQFIESKYEELNEFEQELETSNELIEAALQAVLKNEKQIIKERMKAEFFGSGPLTNVMDNEEVCEIVVNSFDKIFYEINNCFTPLTDTFLSARSFEGFIRRVLNEANLQFDLKTPYCSGEWKGFRVHIIAQPLSHKTQITLRRIKSTPWTLSELSRSGHFNHELQKTFERLIAQKQNFLIVGPTGCGKTSYLNALVNSLPQNHRCVVIEDTQEIKLPNQVSTRLLTRDVESEDLPVIDASELVKQSLRMRPQSLVMGEVRGKEAKDYLLSLSTGHTGFCSLHAKSARQALLRLEMLASMGAPEWKPETIRNLISESLNIIITLGFVNNSRSLLAVDRLICCEEDQFILQPIYEKGLSRNLALMK